MDRDSTVPLLSNQSSSIRINEDEDSSDSSNISADSAQRKRRSRLPFHYPHVHKNSRVRREAGADRIATYQRYRYYNKLADPSIDTLSIPDHVVPPTFFFPFATLIKPVGKQSSFITIFSIWNTMMGSSLLSIPWAIQQAGFACGLVIMVAMGSLCFYTAYRIVNLRSIAEFPKSAVEFPDLCRYLLGPWAEWIAAFFSLIPLLGGAIVYFVLLSNFLFFIGVYAYESLKSGVNSNSTHTSLYPDVYCPNVVPTNSTANVWSAHSNTTAEDTFYEYWDMDGTLPFYIAAVFLPLVSLKSPTFFTKLNALGTLSVVYLIAFVITKGAKWGVHFEIHDASSISYVHLFQDSFPVLIGTLSLSFFIHNCVLSIMRNQANPQNNARDLAIAYFLVGATYFVIGGVFFVTFPFEKGCIQDNFLNNFKSDDVMTVVTRVFLSFQVLTLYPLIVYILRAQVLHFAFHNVYPSWKHVLVLNLTVLSVCVLFNVYMPKVGTIIRYCGAISGLAYIFTLPCVTYMKALKDQKILSLSNAAIHCVIIAVGVANFTSQFMVKTEK